MAIWVLTEELAQYDVETTRPYREDYIGFVLDGGGRYEKGKYYDSQWYILKEIK